MTASKPKPPFAAEPAASNRTDTPPRHGRLFRNGADQALRIPRELELPTSEATIRKMGNTLVIEPVELKLIEGNAASLPAVLATMQSINEDFPDVDGGLLSLDDIDL